MFRRKSNTSLQEAEMMERCQRELQSVGDEGDPMKRLRLICLSHGANGILGMGRMFRRLDDDGRKHLNKEQFIQELRQTGLNLTENEALRLFQKFDDGTGFIDMTEFLHNLRPAMCDSRIKDLEKAFHKMDKSGEGFITMDDLRHLYCVKANPRYVSGEESEEQMLKKYLADFELNATKDGMLTHEEFMNYYSAVSASIDNDGFFDLMIRLAYKL